MEKERNVKNLVILGLVLTVLCMSVAFAGMRADLNVGGTVNLPNAEWSVGFTSATLVDGSVGEQADLIHTNNTVTYTVNLTENATYEFNAVIQNNGTYGAKLVNYTVSEIPEALDGIVTYNVTPLTVNSTVIPAKNGNVPGELVINVKVSMGELDSTEDIAAVKANSSFDLTILAEFVQE